MTPIVNNQTNGITDWKVGDRVEHLTFGKGTVTQIIDKLIVINFDNTAFGKKTFLGSHNSIRRI